MVSKLNYPTQTLFAPNARLADVSARRSPVEHLLVLHSWRCKGHHVRSPSAESESWSKSSSPIGVSRLVLQVIGIPCPRVYTWQGGVIGDVQIEEVETAQRLEARSAGKAVWQFRGTRNRKAVNIGMYMQRLTGPRCAELAPGGEWSTK